MAKKVKQIKKKTPKAKKPGVYETRRNEINELAQRALKNLNDIERSREYYKKKGYYIEHEEWIDNAKANINRIMSKPRPNKNDIQMMSDMATVHYFDYIKFNKVDYQKIRPKAKKLTKKVQKVLEEAKELYPEKIKTNVYSPYLQALVQDLKDTTDLAEAGEDTGFYTISDEYDPKKEETLYKDIDIKSIPYTPETEAIVDATEQVLQEERIRVQRIKDDIKRSQYDTNVNKMPNLDVHTIYALENIMNASGAWEICSKDAYDSDQVMENWLTLYDEVKTAYENDFEVFDTVVNMIENSSENSLDDIINYVDSIITDAM